ncbi:MAG: ATP-binding cassette domain-containing protein [Bosea sp.]|nr:ATP-binding cassette domain-containing protein [Bosea sp. (in: a-proteobacteria)]
MAVSEQGPSAIELRDVELSLGRGAARVHILKGVSLAIAEGQATGLTGPSGSGKSTLLMTMAGLERPDSGLVRVAGQDLGALGEDELALFRGRRIGIVFQSFHLVPTMTARENVALPLELAGAADAFERAAAELRNVGLGHGIARGPRRRLRRHRRSRPLRPTRPQARRHRPDRLGPRAVARQPRL